jgi:hypothetical protein
MSNSLEKGENRAAIGMDEDEAELARMGTHINWLTRPSDPTVPYRI